MINSYYQNATDQRGNPKTQIDLGGNTHIVIFRSLKYSFKLMQFLGEVKAPPIRLFVNTETDKAGAMALIEAMKTHAITEQEEWTEAQENAIQGAQTLYIIYKDAQTIDLSFSTNILTQTEIEEENMEAEKVLVSNNISDLGLILLVNDLLAWMATN